MFITNALREYGLQKKLVILTFMLTVQKECGDWKLESLSSRLSIRMLEDVRI